MNTRKLDYNQIAESYAQQRYTNSPHSGTAKALLELVEQNNLRQVLEVGCGTGRWLMELEPISSRLVGLDRSIGMLEQARKQQANLQLLCGQAEQLPFEAASFELVFCANAVHHFDDPRQFIAEAGRILKDAGKLAVIGMSPPTRAEQWYLYQYFNGTFERDVQRYPAWDKLASWLQAAGFEQTEWQQVELIKQEWTEETVLNDPFLKKESTSQLTILSDEEYADGLQKLQMAVAKATDNAEKLLLPVQVEMGMLVGSKKQER